MAIAATPDDALLAAARAGDDDAYGRIAPIPGFADPAPFARFGLPDRLPAD